MLRIADSSALVALALCGGLNLLDQLFDIIKVSQAVYDEVIIKNKLAAQSLQVYLQGKVVPVSLTTNILFFPIHSLSHFPLSYQIFNSPNQN